MTPTTVNGYPVVKARPTPALPMTRAGHVILVRRDSGDYVTAWIAEGDTSWWRGNYIDGLIDAEIDFDRRVRRGW